MRRPLHHHAEEPPHPFASRWRFRQLLTAFCVMVVVLPALEDFTGLRTTAAGLTVLVIGVLFASGRRHHVSMLIFAALVLALIWVHDLTPGSKLDVAHYFAIGLLLFYSTYVTLSYIMRSDSVTGESLAAATSAYLLFGMAMAAVFAGLSSAQPGCLSFSSIKGPPALHDHIYFSFVVMTTIGFGDVTPVSNLCKSLVVLEGVVGVFYLAIIISRLVSLYSSVKK